MSQFEEIKTNSNTSGGPESGIEVHELLPAGREPGRINLDSQNPGNGLAQLVLTLVKLLHELLEKQAIRRVEAGDLTDEQIEKLGLTLMKQTEELERIRKEFGLEPEDLNLDLGPLGKLM